MFYMPPYQSKPKGGLKMKVMLDAGHYGKHNKGVVSGYYESVQMWKLHKFLKSALEGYGIKVDITRKTLEEDMHVELRGRAAQGYDLFLSLHSNSYDSSNPDPEADAPYMCVLQDLSWTSIDDISKGLGHKLGETIQNTIGTKQKYKIYQRKADKDRDNNGIMDDEFYGVLKGCRIVGVPGLILEHSFHSNERACKWLLNDNNLKTLAEAEARTIAEYFGIIKLPEKVSKKFKVTALALTIRKGAGANNGVAGYLVKGQIVDVCEISDGWGRLADGRGWIGLSATEEVKEAKPIAIPFVQKKVKVTASVLNIRKGVGISYSKTGVLRKDEVVAIVEEKDNWGKLSDGRGWIGLAYTEVFKQETKPAEQPPVQKKVKVTASALNVRKGAGSSHEVVGWLKKGDIVTIIDEKDGWGRLIDGRGWIGLKYTKEVY